MHGPLAEWPVQQQKEVSTTAVADVITRHTNYEDITPEEREDEWTLLKETSPD